MQTYADATTLQHDVEQTHWYHTIDLPHGVVTPGLFDLRGVVSDVLPDDLSGKRCLDACSSSGFWALEMERRGAREVVAIDIASFRDQDWQLPDAAPEGGEIQRSSFEIARDALGSAVKRHELSVYDVSPDSLGTFDFVFIGSVLLHLRDPVKALRALRSVCTGELRSFDIVRFWASLVRPNAATGSFFVGNQARWWTPSTATHKRWLVAAGFEIGGSKRFIFQKQGALRRELVRRSTSIPLRRRLHASLLTRIGVPSQLLIAR